MKLSIITINLNNKVGLSKTLISVFEQTFSDYEYIVIDGGSTDGSVELIKEYSSKLAYFISEKDGGVYYAMNKGLAKANGEYCLFLNSGDYLFSKNVFEKVFANNFIHDIICGNVISVNGWKHKSPEKLSMYIFFASSLPHQATFIKTLLLQKMNGYSTEFKIISDWLFPLNAFVGGITYKHLPMTIAFYDCNGISSNIERRNEEKNKIWQEQFPYLINDFQYMQELEYELKIAYKLPVIKFFVRRVYPFLRKIYRYLKNILLKKNIRI